MTCLLKSLLLGSIVLIASCAGLQREADFDADWAFKGKMAVRNATEASSVNVTWTQLNQAYEIDLSGPLGQGAVSVNGRPGAVSMTQGDTLYTASSLSELVLATADIDLPLDHLQYWVRGRPSPLKSATVTRNSAGQITAITQDAWQVDISEYFDGDELLPRKLQFVRDENLGKLIIREWTLPTLP